MGNPVSGFQKPDIQNPDRSFHNGIRKSALEILLALCNRIKGSKRQCFLYMTEYNLCVLCVLCGKLTRMPGGAF
jgi:hypothetical protein